MALLSLCITVMALRAIERIGGSRWQSGALAPELIRVFTHISLFALAYGLIWRPLTSLVVAVLALTALSVINEVKRRVVFEPVVFSDFGLLGQVLRHPELYFMDRPGPVFAALAGFCAALALAFWLEPPVAPSLPAYALLGLGWLGLFLAKRAIRQRFGATLLDQREGWGSARFGLVTALVLQFIAWLDARNDPLPAVAAVSSPTDRCDMVIMQLESFVDLSPHMNGNPALWPQLAAQSRMHGKLRVEARGANTMRTEHAVLSGIANAALGFRRFDPYMRAPAQPHGIVETMRRLGWTTIFVHPNELDFFRRDRNLPKLGFETLIGRDAFCHADISGPYVGDVAVVEQIIEQLQGSGGAKLVFAVTMENHGPWKAGRLEGVPSGLAGYLAHQQRTDQALEKLFAFAAKSPRRMIIVLYGDHTPALEGMPAEFDPYQTDYLIFDSQGGGASCKPTSLLPERLLQAAVTMI